MGWILRSIALGLLGIYCVDPGALESERRRTLGKTDVETYSVLALLGAVDAVVGSGQPGGPNITWASSTPGRPPHAPSLASLALLLEDGLSFSPPDPGAAMLLWQRAAQIGYPLAQSEYALRLSLGSSPLHPLGATSKGGPLHFSQSSPHRACLHTPDALLQHAFAASADHLPSLMALGYRHKVGLGVPKSCRAASGYYRRAAELVVRQVANRSREAVQRLARLAGEAPALTPVAEGALSLSSYSGSLLPRAYDEIEEEWSEGVRGGGGSAWAVVLGSSSVPHPRGAWRMRLSSWERQGFKRIGADRQGMFELARASAEGGHITALTQVGKALAFGSPGMATERDPSQAAKFLLRAANQGAGDACAHLGHLYMNGLGVSRDPHVALAWFERGAKLNSPGAQVALGLAYLEGLGRPRDVKAALDLFLRAAELGEPEAHYALGVLYSGAMRDHPGAEVVKTDVDKALVHFTYAANAGHLSAAHSAATLLLSSGRGSVKSCESSLELLKDVAERGPGALVLARSLVAFQRGDHVQALRGYLRAADMGYEVAESNVAYLLQRGMGAEGPGTAEWALRYQLRSALQGHTAAFLSIGDAWFSGDGVPVRYPHPLAGINWNDSAAHAHAHAHVRAEKRNFRKAAQAYRSAAESRNPQGLFNLAFMHQVGLGVPRDLHLAKRYYDMCEGVGGRDSKPAVFLARTLLRLHQALYDHYEPSARWIESFLVGIALRGFRGISPAHIVARIMGTSAKRRDGVGVPSQPLSLSAGRAYTGNTLVEVEGGRGGKGGEMLWEMGEVVLLCLMLGGLVVFLQRVRARRQQAPTVAAAPLESESEHHRRATLGEGSGVGGEDR